MLLCAGIILRNRSNCQQIADVSDDSNQQRLHHLLSKAKWQASALMNEVAVQFVKQIEPLELQDDLQLIIDESGFAKKGKKSKGVARPI
jgi:SRSO17 transposase